MDQRTHWTTLTKKLGCGIFSSYLSAARNCSVTDSRIRAGARVSVKVGMVREIVTAEILKSTSPETELGSAEKVKLLPEEMPKPLMEVENYPVAGMNLSTMKQVNDCTYIDQHSPSLVKDLEAEEMSEYSSLWSEEDPGEINSPTTKRELTRTNSFIDEHSPPILKGLESDSFTYKYSFASFYLSGCPKDNTKLYLALSDNTGLKKVIKAHKNLKLLPKFSKAVKLYVTEPDVGDIAVGADDVLCLLITIAPCKPSMFGRSKASEEPTLPFATIPLSELRKRYKSPVQGQSYEHKVGKETLNFFYKISKEKTGDIRLKEEKKQRGKAIGIAKKIGDWIIPTGIYFVFQCIPI